MLFTLYTVTRFAGQVKNLQKQTDQQNTNKLSLCKIGVGGDVIECHSTNHNNNNRQVLQIS